MRLSPSLGGILPREVLPGGLHVERQFFPVGTIVGTPLYAIHHNEAYFPDAFSFNPSRWIAADTGDQTLESIGLLQSAFAPFGTGPRGCVGKTMAYTEMMVLLARIVWLYDIQLKPGSTLGEGHPTLGEGRTRKNEFQFYDKFVSKTEGPLVEFRFRSMPGQ